MSQAMGKTVSEYNQNILKRSDFHTFMSGLGLILIIIGFAFQLVATWIPTNMRKQNIEPVTAGVPDIRDSNKEEQDQAPLPL
jgi:hypothetical protein